MECFQNLPRDCSWKHYMNWLQKFIREILQKGLHGIFLKFFQRFFLKFLQYSSFLFHWKRSMILIWSSSIDPFRNPFIHGILTRIQIHASIPSRTPVGSPSRISLGMSSWYPLEIPEGMSLGFSLRIPWYFSAVQAGVPQEIPEKKNSEILWWTSCNISRFHKIFWKIFFVDTFRNFSLKKNYLEIDLEVF